MKIAVIGTGYVGLVSGACFSEFGFDVTCVDNDPDKIIRIGKGEMPIYEPGLAELVGRNAAADRLHFTTDLQTAVAAADAAGAARSSTPPRRPKRESAHGKGVSPEQAKKPKEPPQQQTSSGLLGLMMIPLRWHAAGTVGKATLSWPPTPPWLLRRRLGFARVRNGGAQVRSWKRPSGSRLAVC